MAGLVPAIPLRQHSAMAEYYVYPDVRDALQREKNMKHWPRVWKTRLIVHANPTWRDLYDEIAGGSILPS
jgi:putative endonuclease